MAIDLDDMLAWARKRKTLCEAIPKFQHNIQRYVDLIVILEGLMADQGWRAMTDCPADGRKVWTWNQLAPSVAPMMREADGDWWRSQQEKLASVPSHWRPFVIPTPPTVTA